MEWRQMDPRAPLGKLVGRPGKRRLFPRNPEGLVLEDQHWPLRGHSGGPVGMVLAVHTSRVGHASSKHIRQGELMF